MNTNTLPTLKNEIADKWQRMTEAEEIKEIKSLINSLMSVAALNQVALEGFTNKLIFSVL